MVEDQPKPFGRPTKYTPELQVKADYYAENWKETDDVIPSQVGLADYLDIGETTLAVWANDESKPEFRDTLNRISTKQHRTTLNKGLTGDFSAPITKLVLHNHGYSDKSQQELSGPNGNPIEVDTVWTVNVHEVPAAKDDA